MAARGNTLDGSKICSTSGGAAPWRAKAALLHKAIPTASSEVIAAIVAGFCFEAHPVAKLIKPLQFRRETVRWRDGTTDDAERNVTHRLFVSGAQLRECFVEAGGAPFVAGWTNEDVRDWCHE